MNNENLSMQSDSKKEKTGVSPWLAVVVGVGALAVTLGLWKALDAKEKAEIDRIVNLQATQLKSEIEEHLEQRILALVHIARRWDLWSNLPQEEWQSDVDLYIRHLPGFRAIGWIDSSFNVRWIFPQETNEAAQGKNLGVDGVRRTALEAARDQRQVTSTPPLDLIVGGRGFLVNVPIYQGEEFNGFVVGVFRYQELLDSILEPNVTLGCATAIFDGDDEIYSRYDSTDHRHQSERRKQVAVSLYGINWRLLVWPGPALRSQVLSPHLPEMTLVSGILMAILLAAATRLAQTARQRSKRLELVNKKLESEIAERARAESALRNSEEKLARLNRLYSVLSEVNQVIVRTRDREKLFADVCRIAVEHGSFRLAWIGLVDTTTSSLRLVAHWGFEEGYIEKIRIPSHSITEGRGPACSAIREGKHFICNDIEHDPSMLPWRDEALKRGYRSVAALVLKSSSNPIGTLNVYAVEPYFFNDQEVGLLDELAADISFALDSMQQQEQRKRAEEFTKNILESMGEGLIVVDREYKVVSANKAYCDRLNMRVEDIIGKFCYEVSHHRPTPCHEAGENCAVKRTFETGRSFTVVHTHYDSRQNPLYMEIRSYPLKDASGVIVSAIEVVNDVTEKRKLEDQLRHAQKMEAVGQLAGGVAHDFNNILTAILGYGNLLRMKLKEGDPLRGYVEQILTSSERAANLTQSLLAFSRKQVIHLKAVDLNEIIRSVQKLLARLIREDIELKINLSKEELIVMADTGQIEQVLMNLATNAKDAMPEAGILSIITKLVELDSAFISTHGYGQLGMYAMISVTDTGTGMDEETRAKIFEPFFTTKEIGKGTGLGLAIVYGIIKQHRGYINVYSEPGRGTTFKIYLPVAGTKAHKADSSALVRPPGGTETILVAEDEVQVRTLTRTVLEEFGYKVIEAVDGEGAVAKFLENKDKIHLVILDVVMPKKSGKQAYEEINRIKPEVKILFTSGYTADLIHNRELLGKDVDFVSKPASPNELLKKVREVLDRGMKDEG